MIELLLMRVVVDELSCAMSRCLLAFCLLLLFSLLCGCFFVAVIKKRGGLTQRFFLFYCHQQEKSGKDSHTTTETTRTRDAKKNSPQ